jgi:SAM-dependent methyltransferase
MRTHGVGKPYRWLAEYYDDLFASMRSPLDAARGHALQRILPRVKTACDLACGTGITAIKLASAGIRTYAVDRSPGMCRAVREKARRTGLPIRVIQADMRAFRLPEPVDLITCEFDALNHVPRKADLGAVARRAARALRPGGHFFFDVNNALGFANYWSGDVWMEKPGVVAVMRNRHNSRATRAWSDVEWFVREGGLWRRHREHIEEVCWTSSEIHRAFEAAGFDRLRAWDEAPFFADSRVGPGCRTAYLARRAERSTALPRQLSRPGSAG